MKITNHTRESAILQRIMSPVFWKAMAESEGYLAGGCVRGVFSGEPIKDFDIFFRDRDHFDACLERLKDGGDSPTFTTTDTAWTHKHEDGYFYQLICAEFGEPSDVIRKFDFTCCMGAFDPVFKAFTLDDLFLKHCAQRRLVFNANAAFPICSLWRAVKFIRRDWKLSGIEAIKLALAVNNLKLNDRKELKRQLMGIDTLFLKELTDALESDQTKAYDFGEAIDMLVSFADAE